MRNRSGGESVPSVRSGWRISQCGCWSPCVSGMWRWPKLTAGRGGHCGCPGPRRHHRLGAGPASGGGLVTSVAREMLVARGPYRTSARPTRAWDARRRTSGRVQDRNTLDVIPPRSSGSSPSQSSVRHGLITATRVAPPRSRPKRMSATDRLDRHLSCRLRSGRSARLPSVRSDTGPWRLQRRGRAMGLLGAWQLVNLVGDDERRDVV